MANMLWAARNYATEIGAVFSGGDWVSTLPLANLANKQPTKYARSTDLDKANTQFDLDCGSELPISFISLRRHNLSQNGKWQIRLSNESDFSTLEYDSGWVDIWPAVSAFGIGLWGEFQWGGKLPESEVSTYGIASYDVFGTAIRARYLRIELDDTGNDDGYLQAGVLFVGPGWTPSINMSYGWTIEQIDNSTITRSRGGQSYVNQQPIIRRLVVSFDYLPEAEIYGNIFEIARKGRSLPVIAMPDPDNTDQLHRQVVYGHLTGDIKIINPDFKIYSAELVVEEII